MMLFLLAPAPTLASPPPPPSALPAAKLAQELGYFVGSWNIVARDPRTGVEEALSYKVEPALGGSWLSGVGASVKGDFAARDMWSRDPARGAIFRLVFNGDGSYAIFRSPGWQGDTLVFDVEKQSAPGAPRVRQTITRIGPDEFRAVWEMFRDGGWITYSDERVTRARST